MKQALIITLFVGLLGINLPAQVPTEASVAQERGSVEVLKPSSEVNRLRSAAQTHEEILNRLAEHDYEAVYPLFWKILALGLEGEHETTLVDAAWVIVKDLRQNRQFALAHHIIDATMSSVSSDDNRWRLLMLKAQTYRDGGDLGEARRMIIAARELEP